MPQGDYAYSRCQRGVAVFNRIPGHPGRLGDCVPPGEVAPYGDHIGMMKFGSRLDMYLPISDVNVVIRKGDRVKEGLTVVVTTKPKP